MKVIFLDIDGVLNSAQSANFWYSKTANNVKHPILEDWSATLEEYQTSDFCPISVTNLCEALSLLPEIKIVISSTWRLSKSVEDLKKIFSPWPIIANKIIDKTPCLRLQERGDEIKAWLDEHKKHCKVDDQISDFVIIDDDNDMNVLEQYLIRTDSNVGLDWNKMKEVVKRLK